MTTRRTNEHRNQEPALEGLCGPRWRALQLRAGWEASVFSKRDDKKIRKTFANKAEAKTWRDANTQLAKGGLRAPKPTTIREAWEE